MARTEHQRQVVRNSADRGAVSRDRRVRRTRKLLHDAFLELVIEKGYEKITIQDILDRADVGRSTFYVHYRDKEALLTASFDGMRDQLESELEEIPATSVIDVALGSYRAPRTSLTCGDRVTVFQCIPGCSARVDVTTP